jgi:pimeloyl-ACP methyl ester carboxylesterase
VATFVLIHGSMHGAWCWRDLAPALEAKGHVAIAPELPCEEAGAGLTEYAAAVEAQLAVLDRGEELIVVGHSLGSRTVPLVAAARPASRMIFLCSAPTALGPVDTESFGDMVTREYATAEFEERSDGARRIRGAVATSLFFHDCDEATAAWASRQLRWQGPKPLAEASPLSNWPDRPMQMIVARDDRVARPDWLMGEASHWLGSTAPIILPGGHSPMLSRPALLASVLIDCSQDHVRNASSK